MRLLIRNIFNVSIRHVYQRATLAITGARYHEILQPRYGGSTHIKVNLKTNDLKQVAKQVSILNKRYDSTLASLRGNLV